jgi:hypothetical protein
MSKACRETTTPTATNAGICRPLTRRTADSTSCPEASRLLALESSAIATILAADEQPFPIREYLRFRDAQARRLEHEQICDKCQREIEGRVA